MIGADDSDDEGPSWLKLAQAQAQTLAARLAERDELLQSIVPEEGEEEDKEEEPEPEPEPEPQVSEGAPPTRRRETPMPPAASVDAGMPEARQLVADVQPEKRL